MIQLKQRLNCKKNCHIITGILLILWLRYSLCLIDTTLCCAFLVCFHFTNCWEYFTKCWHFLWISLLSNFNTSIPLLWEWKNGSAVINVYFWQGIWVRLMLSVRDILVHLVWTMVHRNLLATFYEVCSEAFYILTESQVLFFAHSFNKMSIF